MSDLSNNLVPRAGRSSQIMAETMGDRFGFTQQRVWFDVSIFYVRVSSCSSDDTPEELSMLYPPRDISTVLEVNGGRIAPAEQLKLNLRRDRLDTEASEAMYVSTDKFRSTGTVSFEVYDKEDILLSGSLGRSDIPVESEGQGTDKSAAGTRPKAAKTEWKIDVTCAITSPRSSILKGRQEFSNNPLCPPTMEVCVVGRYAGFSVALTETVQLTARRKLTRRSTLDAIVEGDERETSASDQLEDRSEQGSSSERDFAHQADKALARLGNGYGSDFPVDGVIKGYVENEDGDLSWFNAGFRVGVGIGLGMCLGMGIGVGLLVRTYQATARTVRRNLF